MAIRAVIVDDEQNNRENLETLIREYCNEVEVVGLAESVDTAYRLILAEKPDLVFLDIRMPKKNGFKLLESLDEVRFEVIIVTAYDQYAIKAIRFCAIDYLLKPIDTVELVNAIQHVSRRMEEKRKNRSLQQLVQYLNSQKKPTKIGLSSQKKVEFVEISGITRCEADNNYTYIHFDTGKRMIISKTLKEFEELLTEYGFIRVHQTHLVNTSHIQSYRKNDGGLITMRNGATVPISRARKNEIIGLIRKMCSIRSS